MQRAGTVTLRGIEASSDPSIFFGDNPDGSISQLRLGASGLTSIASQKFNLLGREIVSDGNTLFSGWNKFDATNLRFLGTFLSSSQASFGAVRPELARNRVYLLESLPVSSGSAPYLSAYDPSTYLPVRRSTLPSVYLPLTQSFIRWGENGLAFRATYQFADSIAIVRASQLVPADAASDVSVALQDVPNAASAGTPMIYRVNITNKGPNIARTVFLTATLSDGQLIQNAASTSGTPSVTGHAVQLPLGNLLPGAPVTLTITATPQNAGRSVSCSVEVASSSIDPLNSNNAAVAIVPVGFSSAQDAVNQLRLSVNNLVADEARGLLWATIPATVSAPLGRSLTAIDPRSGRVLEAVPLHGSPTANCMALTPNGRYLYIGLSDVPEVVRVDLDSASYDSVRISLGLDQWGNSARARDLETLEGDGTSFLVLTEGDRAVSVFDGAVRRPNRTGIYSTDRFEKTSAPDVFIATTNSATSRLTVNASGVAVSQTVSGVTGGTSVEIRSSSDLLVSSFGEIANSASMTRVASVTRRGAPSADAANRRAYIATASALHAFDAANGMSAGSLPMPEPPADPFGDWAKFCVRWGADGFAIAGSDKIYLARWSSAIAPDVDQDGDHLADAWEAANFGTLDARASRDDDGDGLTNGFEYIFATSPLQANATPLQPNVARAGGATVLHLLYPRRQQRVSDGYIYEITTDFARWQPASNVTETIVSITSTDGVTVDVVDAAVPAPNSSGAFVRLRWLNP